MNSILWQEFFRQLQAFRPDILDLFNQEWLSGRMKVWSTDYLQRLVIGEDENKYQPIKDIVRESCPLALRQAHIALLRAGL